MLPFCLQGHIATACPTSGANFGGGFGRGGGSRAPAPGASAGGVITCNRCGGANHIARNCLADASSVIGTSSSGAFTGKPRACFKCHLEGHVSLLSVYSASAY